VLPGLRPFTSHNRNRGGGKLSGHAGAGQTQDTVEEVTAEELQVIDIDSTRRRKRTSGLKSCAHTILDLNGSPDIRLSIHRAFGPLSFAGVRVHKLLSDAAVEVVCLGAREVRPANDICSSLEVDLASV
jgi:hypothetical protein